MRFIALIPIGIEQLVKASGWTPVGKSVELLIEEGFDPSLIGERLIGTVTSLNTSDLAIVTMASGNAITVGSRHVGYGFYYLRVGKLAAYLLDNSRAGDARVAQGILALRR
jgi:hypothetical protein